MKKIKIKYMNICLAFVSLVSNVDGFYKWFKWHSKTSNPLIHTCFKVHIRSSIIYKFRSPFSFKLWWQHKNYKLHMIFFLSRLHMAFLLLPRVLKLGPPWGLQTQLVSCCCPPPPQPTPLFFKANIYLGNCNLIALHLYFCCFSFVCCLTFLWAIAVNLKLHKKRKVKDLIHLYNLVDVLSINLAWKLLWKWSLAFVIDQGETKSTLACFVSINLQATHLTIIIVVFLAHFFPIRFCFISLTFFIVVFLVAFFHKIFKYSSKVTTCGSLLMVFCP